jgi:hypothetical protein
VQAHADEQAVAVALGRHGRMTECDPSAASAHNFCCDAQRRSSDATAW